MTHDELIEEMLIRWTARLAVACYAMRLFCDAGRDWSISSRRAARWWWTIGCGWFLLHVVAAFHFEHGWNHAEAFQYTANRTVEMTGWNSGTGLYVNEAFLCVWLADTILWWRKREWPNDRRIYWLIQGTFGFLMLQATAVFGPAFWKPVVAVIIVILWFRSSRNLVRPSSVTANSILGNGRQEDANH